MKKRILMLTAAAISCAAYAGSDGGVEWKLLGPAFSHHADRNAGRIEKPVSGVMDCKTVLYESGLRSIDCQNQVNPAQIGFSEINAAAGLEVSRLSSPGATSRDFAFATFVLDSYSQKSLMAGVGRKWELAKIGTVNVSGGISGGLWYRSIAAENVPGGEVRYCQKLDGVVLQQDNCSYSPGADTYYVTPLNHKFVPFILPMLDITEKTTGLGANISIIPKMNLGQNYKIPTTTVMLQLTWKMDL